MLSNSYKMMELLNITFYKVVNNNVMFYISIIVVINGAKVFILRRNYNKYNINILLNTSHQLKICMRFGHV